MGRERRGYWFGRRAALASVLLTGCYPLTDFDGLGSSSTASSSATAATTTAGSGGSASTGTTSGSGGGDATTSTTGSGGGGDGGAGGTTTATTVGSGGGATGAGTGSGGGGGAGGGEVCSPPGFDYTGLIMNELAPKGLPDDWIELRNNSTRPMPLCGVMIVQDYDDITVPDGPDRFTFGPGIFLAPGKYLVVASGPELPYGLAKDAPERITMFSPDLNIIDETAWSVDSTNEFTPYESWGRIPDGTGEFVRTNNPTKGTSNFLIDGAGGGQ